MAQNATGGSSSILKNWLRIAQIVRYLNLEPLCNDFFLGEGWEGELKKYSLIQLDRFRMILNCVHTCYHYAFIINDHTIRKWNDIINSLVSGSKSVHK